MKEYFCKKEYIFLYLSKFFYAFGNSFIDIFGVVMLYENGMPIYQIFLLYGLRFGIMGLLSPLFLKISSKFGVASCALIANILRIVSTYMILEGAYNNLFVFIMAMSLPGALSNPIEDSISSRYVDSSHRGRYNSLRNISRALGSVMASVVIAWGVITSNNIVLLLVISIFFLLDYLFTAFVDYKPDIKSKKVFRDTFKYIFKSSSNYKTVYSLRTIHIVERLFLPLYLYLALKDFVLFSTVITISLSIQVITVFIIGKFADKDIKKSNNLVSVIRILITTIFLCIKNKMIISFNKTVHDNFEKVYETSIQTSLQNIIKKSDENSSFLSTVGQMSLCFTELIVFPILALISFFINDNVFYIIFALSILVTVLINIKINKGEN